MINETKFKNVSFSPKDYAYLEKLRDQMSDKIGMKVSIANTIIRKLKDADGKK